MDNDGADFVVVGGAEFVVGGWGEFALNQRQCRRAAGEAIYDGDYVTCDDVLMRGAMRGAKRGGGGAAAGDSVLEEAARPLTHAIAEHCRVVEQAVQHYGDPTNWRESTTAVIMPPVRDEREAAALLSIYGITVETPTLPDHPPVPVERASELENALRPYVVSYEKYAAKLAEELAKLTE